MEEIIQGETLEGGHLWLFEVPVATEGKNKGNPFEGTAYFDKIPQEWKDEWRDKEISKSDWGFDNPYEADQDKEFRAFINSHIPQFDQLKAYKKFYLYCEQARRMTENAVSLSEVAEAERYEWKKNELEKIAENTLYGLNSIITIREDGYAGGRRKFKASAPHALLAYVIDCGLSFELVKGRQAAVTSAMMAIAVIKSVITPSWSGVFMVHKKDGTGKALFRDKYQSTLQHIPRWMVGGIDVSKGFSTEAAILDFDRGQSKLERGMDISEFRLLSADDSMAVNGRTPTLSLFDEAQNIPTFQSAKGEIKPTMYRLNDASGELELKAQIAAWGTGSSNNLGNGSFESDYFALLDAWEGGARTKGWVPLFFDWSCRPGMTKKFYLDMKEDYMLGNTEETKGLTETERSALFNSHYPRKPDDAFMTTHRTMIPMELIVRQQNRIMDLCHKKGLAPQPGRFEPVFDLSVKLPEQCYFQHPVRDVRWVPAPMDDITAPVKMFLDRDMFQWKDRWYQGTDPISNDGGFSRFASAIIDLAAKQVFDDDGTISNIPTIACVLNARTAFPKELFVQCVLMGMYYRNAGQRACKELVEINAGQRYVDFKCGPEFNLRESLITRQQLPIKYRGGTHTYGLDLKGGSADSRKEHLYGHITDFVRSNWANIWYYDIWSQIRHISVRPEANGTVKWGTQNKNVYNDDMVYAMGYSALCAETLDARPTKIDAEYKEYKIKKRVIRDQHGNVIDIVKQKVEVTYA